MSGEAGGRAVKVSVLLKSFNYAPYLPTAIESALAQDAPFPYEIVLSDDCSQDECPAIVRDYARRFPEKVRVLERTARVGMVRNTMETFAACRGEYIAWLEGDDYWVAQDKLRKQAELLDRHRSSWVAARALGYSRRMARPGISIQRLRTSGCWRISFIVARFEPAR